MISMNSTLALPPVALSDDAIRLVGTLLQVIANPAASEARLQQLTAATQELRDAIAGHDVAKSAADAAADALGDLQQQKQNLADRESDLAQARTALDVASSANVARAQALDDREAELAKKIAAHEAKVAANEQRLAAVRASLA